MTPVDALLDQMTLDEKCALLHGRDAWTVDGCDRVGVPAWTVSDGPVGIRGRGGTPTACFPSASAIAASFDLDLIRALGTAIGEEAQAKDVVLALGPTINLHRHPLGGRHFECYSEDPLLTARVAAAYIGGVQATGVGACAKHYVANDQEFERHTVDVRVDERTLREVYLPPFEAAVVDAGVRSVMGAYNFVNGDHACAHAHLLEGVLKDEWGFEGFVVTDWGALKETVGPARHGCDLEMPGPGRFWGRSRLADAVRAGAVDEAMVDDKARRILSFLEWCGATERAPDAEERRVDSPEQRALARRAAAAGTVLLRNERGRLPLDASSLRSVAVLGPNAADTATMGGGSATVTAYRQISVLDGLTDALPADVEVRHAPGCSITRAVTPLRRDDLDGPGVAVELYASDDLSGPLLLEGDDHPGQTILMEELPDDAAGPSARATARYRAPEGGTYRFSGGGLHHVRFSIDGELVGTNDDPGAIAAGLGNRAITVERRLEAGELIELGLEYRAEPGLPIVFFTLGADRIGDDPEADAAAQLEEAVEAAAGADVAVVVVGSNDQWETEGGDRDDLTLPGDQDELVARVAEVNDRVVVVHNAGAPMTMPWVDDVDAIVQVWYPGQEGGDAVADVLLGRAEPAGRLPTTWPRRLQDTPAFGSYPGRDGVMTYEEGLLVGHRWYDAHDIEPLWAFGHGGSYTTFAWGDVMVERDADGAVSVAVEVTNTGDRPGVEIVQVYVEPPPGPVDRPVRTLAGFGRVELEPGHSSVVRVELSSRSFARWDDSERGWRVDPGPHVVWAGASAVDLRSSVAIDLAGGSV